MAKEKESKERKVKTVQMHAGIDLIGSKTSLSASKKITLLELPQGIECSSSESGRTVVIPYGNIRGYELES